MDFLTLLSTMEYRVLDAKNFELLKTAYALQEQNLEHLRGANAALTENAELLRTRVEQLAAEVAKLRADREALQQILPPDVVFSPSPLARDILAVFQRREATQINDKLDVAEIPGARSAIDAAFEELCAAKLVEMSSIGENGCWFSLTRYGKQFLSNHAPGRSPS
jgi:hypothetical protein